MSKTPIGKHPAIKLVETRRGCAIMESTPRIEVWFHGELFDTLYFNMSGYRGCLPCPEGGKLDIGEQSMGTYRKEVVKLNREFGQQA